MSYENPSYEGEKKFSTMESQEQISFGAGKAKKREPILIVILLILGVICLAFIILYAKERGDNNDSASGSGTSQQGL